MRIGFVHSFKGDLTKPLILSNVAAHTDKIIQARWSVHSHGCRKLISSIVLLGIRMKCRSWRRALTERVLSGLHRCRLWMSWPSHLELRSPTGHWNLVCFLCSVLLLVCSCNSPRIIFKIFRTKLPQRAFLSLCLGDFLRLFAFASSIRVSSRRNNDSLSANLYACVLIEIDLLFIRLTCIFSLSL